jgi:hypothetical protein
LAFFGQNNYLRHAGEMFHRFGVIGDDLLGVPMFDPLADTMIQMPFQNQLTDFM